MYRLQKVFGGRIRDFARIVSDNKLLGNVVRMAQGDVTASVSHWQRQWGEDVEVITSASSPCDVLPPMAVIRHLERMYITTISGYIAQHMLAGAPTCVLALYAREWDIGRYTSADRKDFYLAFPPPWESKDTIMVYFD